MTTNAGGRPKGVPIAESHKERIGAAATRWHTKVRTDMADLVLSQDPAVFMAAVARGVENGSIQPRTIRLILDLREFADERETG